MRMYSEKYRQIAEFKLWTYDEVCIVRFGYTVAGHPNTISVLKTPRKGSFIEATWQSEEDPTFPEDIVEDTSQTPENPPPPESSLTFTLEEEEEAEAPAPEGENLDEAPAEKDDVPVSEALTMGDAEPLVKSKATRVKSKTTRKKKSVRGKR